MPNKAKLVTRQSTSSTVTADNLNKGSALEFTELDSNMINLRDQTFGVAGDDSATIDVGAGDTLYIQGGTNVTTSTNSDGTITINSSAAGDVFKTISVAGQSDVVADASTDTLTLVAGSNMTITTNAGSDTITFAASGGGGTGTLTLTGNQIKTNGDNVTLLSTDSQDDFNTIKAAEFHVDSGDLTTGSGKFVLNHAGLTSNSGLNSLKLSGQEHQSDTSHDSNVILMYGKHIEHHNTNVYYSIKKGGDLIFRGNLGDTSATADTGGFYPLIALREYEDAGNIEITPKPGQPVNIDGVDIKDNTIKTNASNANLEISANGSGKVQISGLKYPTSDGSANQVLKTDGSGNLSFANQSASASGFKIVGDDSAGVDIADGGTLYVQGGTNVTTSTNSDGTITINATDTTLNLIDEDNFSTNSATRPPSQQSVKAYVDAQTLSLIDEDNMSTNSATRPPSQQSVKAYVDAEVSGAGGGGVTVQDEGSGLSTTATTLNFVGAGVTASGTGATKTITIGAGSASTGDFTFSGNKMSTSSSNADVEIEANASGAIRLRANGQPPDYYTSPYSSASTVESRSPNITTIENYIGDWTNGNRLYGYDTLAV